MRRHVFCRQTALSSRDCGSRAVDTVGIEPLTREKPEIRPWATTEFKNPNRPPRGSRKEVARGKPDQLLGRISAPWRRPKDLLPCRIPAQVAGLSPTMSRGAGGV